MRLRQSLKLIEPNGVPRVIVPSPFQLQLRFAPSFWAYATALKFGRIAAEVATLDQK
jgi:hypothetical protein